MTVTHKFKAKPTIRDNIRFPSKKEARYYDELKLRQQSGDVLFFLRQIPIDLPASRYYVDFVEFLQDGTVRFVDVKGMMTPVSQLKIKEVEALYPITITIV